MKTLVNPGNIKNTYSNSIDSIISELKDGKLKAFRNIAGISCESQELAQEVISELSTTQISIRTISEKLKKEGLEHEAIIPLKFWNKIEKESELYRFENLNQQNETYSIHKKKIVKIIKNLDKENRVGLIYRSRDIMSLCIPLCIGYLSFTYLTSFWAWLFSAIGTIMTLGIFLSGIPTIRSKVEVSKNRANYDLKKILFPLNYDYQKDNKKRFKVKINLLQPLKIVQKRITQWHESSYKINISLDQNAFSVENDNYLRRKIYKAVEQQIRREQIKADDPICWTLINGFVVIIAAYGTSFFLTEREVMEKVKSYYNDELAKHQIQLN